MAELTGPTKSGINITKHITLLRMKKNPNSVTIFGANHIGRSSTKAFHYMFSVWRLLGSSSVTYIVLQDVIRNKGFIDTRIFVGFQMNKGFLRNALVCSFLCLPFPLAVVPIPDHLRLEKMCSSETYS